jgi:hypothetical protein
MTKKDFIALADMLKNTMPVQNSSDRSSTEYHHCLGEISQWFKMKNALADFCKSQNPKFNREKFMDYIEKP